MNFLKYWNTRVAFTTSQRRLSSGWERYKEEDYHPREILPSQNQSDISASAARVMKKKSTSDNHPEAASSRTYAEAANFSKVWTIFGGSWEYTQATTWLKFMLSPSKEIVKPFPRGNLAWKVETRQSCQKRPDESSTIVVIQRPSTPNPSKRSLPRYHTFFRKGWGGKGHFRTT